MRLYSNLPSLDLHGVDTVYAKILIEDFIRDQVIMKNKQAIVIHGIGTGKVRKITAETLKKNRHIEEYKLDCFNPGCTFIKIK